MEKIAGRRAKSAVKFLDKNIHMSMVLTIVAGVFLRRKHSPGRPFYKRIVFSKKQFADQAMTPI